MPCLREGDGDDDRMKEDACDDSECEAMRRKDLAGVWESRQADREKEQKACQKTRRVRGGRQRTDRVEHRIDADHGGEGRWEPSELGDENAESGEEGARRPGDGVDEDEAVWRNARAAELPRPCGKARTGEPLLGDVKQEAGGKQKEPPRVLVLTVAIPPRVLW